MTDQERQRVRNLGSTVSPTELKNIARHLAGELFKFSMDLDSSDSRHQLVSEGLVQLDKLVRGIDK